MMREGKKKLLLFFFLLVQFERSSRQTILLSTKFLVLLLHRTHKAVSSFFLFFLLSWKMLCRWMNDEINVLSSHFPVSVNNVRSPLSIAKRKKRKTSVDIIDLDLIEERKRRKKSLLLSFVPLLLFSRERRLIITCRRGAAERQVHTDIYMHTYIRTQVGEIRALSGTTCMIHSYVTNFSLSLATPAANFPVDCACKKLAQYDKKNLVHLTLFSVYLELMSTFSHQMRSISSVCQSKEDELIDKVSKKKKWSCSFSFSFLFPKVYVRVQFRSSFPVSQRKKLLKVVEEIGRSTNVSS